MVTQNRQTKVLKTSGISVQVKSIAECSTCSCIKRLLVLKTFSGLFLLGFTVSGVSTVRVLIDPKSFFLQEVLQRHPLHTLAQVIQYSDGHGTSNLVLKIGQVNKNIFSCYVFQCLSEVII